MAELGRRRCWTWRPKIVLSYIDEPVKKQLSDWKKVKNIYSYTSGRCLWVREIAHLAERNRVFTGAVHTKVKINQPIHNSVYINNFEFYKSNRRQSVEICCMKLNVKYRWSRVWKAKHSFMFSRIYYNWFIEECTEDIENE